FASNGRIVRARGGVETEIVTIAAIPIAFGGAARFNVENVLGVVAAAHALGLHDDAIVRAVTSFSPVDNPRRNTVVERGGVRILLDFGHNPEGVRAVMKLVASLRGETRGRLTILTGSAGDRTDREIAEIARVLHDAGPDRVILRELPDHLRGR